MPPSLLAELAVLISSSPEDVATRGLELILSKSPVACSALDRILTDVRGCPGAPIRRWASQVVGTDKARTDLQGYNHAEETIAILENKFWAGLTDNQPATYLNRIPALGGVLLFVVPRTRVSVIAGEIALRTPSSFGEYTRLPGDHDRIVSRSSDGRTLAVLSWELVLSALQSALEAAEDFDNLADLRQLLALARKMDAEGFRPLTSGDLTGDTPRVLLGLCDLVDGAVQEQIKKPFANKKNLKASAGRGWYGHYFWMHGFGCQLIVTAWRWQSPGRSPIWLRVSNAEWELPTEIRGSLGRAVPDPSWINEDHSRGWTGYWLPITLLERREREPVIADMLRQIDDVASVLSAHASSSSEAVAQEPLAM